MKEQPNFGLRHTKSLSRLAVTCVLQHHDVTKVVARAIHSTFISFPLHCMAMLHFQHLPRRCLLLPRYKSDAMNVRALRQISCLKSIASPLWILHTLRNKCIYITWKCWQFTVKLWCAQFMSIHSILWIGPQTCQNLTKINNVLWPIHHFLKLELLL